MLTQAFVILLRIDCVFLSFSRGFSEVSADVINATLVSSPSEESLVLSVDAPSVVAPGLRGMIATVVVRKKME